MKANQVKVFAWAVSAIATVVAVVGWGQGVSWQFAGISYYQLFPLFGLLAFSLMWSHYIASVARQMAGIEKRELSAYFEITSFVVLAAIILHPGLLIWQLYADGSGLPPLSYWHFVTPAMRWTLWLSTVGFFVLLSYELRRYFQTRSWWKYVEIAIDAAMVAIFIHSLYLGSNLQTGWLRSVWIFYGITLLASLVYIYTNKLAGAKPVPSVSS